MTDIITNKIDTALEGNYHSLISVDKILIHNIINTASKKELFNFLTLEEKNNPDYTLKKILILNNIINNIINNEPEIITNHFNDAEIIKIVKSFDFYNTPFILNIFNHISSDNHVDFLNSKIENTLFSANNFASYGKENIIDLILPEYFSLSHTNNKNTFDFFYNLNLHYLNNVQKEISSKLKEKNLKLFVNKNRIDFYNSKSIDLFFMNKDWFSDKYNSTFNDDKDGLDFLMHSFDSCSTEKNLSYIHKKLNEEISQENKKLMDYLKDKKPLFIEKILSCPSAFPLNGVIKKLFNEDSQKFETETPLLIKYPRLIFENNFLSSLNFFVKHYGLKKLIGDKNQQQKMADFLFNTNQLGYFFKDNNKANNMQKISIKLLDIIKKENTESSPDLIFFFTILSQIDNKNKLEISHFLPEIFHDELEKNLNKPFVKKLFLYFGDEEKEKLNKIILISKEKSKIIESISEKEQNTLKQNKKRL